MKSAKFYEMTNEELNNALVEKKSDLLNLRFKHATNQLSNPQVIVECKKDIARIKTILRQRELGINAEPVKKAKKSAAKK